MPIRVNLDLVLARRGMTLSELAERVGITLPNMSILKTNKARAIRFSTLEAICRELECQPGDLLEYNGVAGTGEPLEARIPPYPAGGRGGPRR